jgi:hypothetical protein
MYKIQRILLVVEWKKEEEKHDTKVQSMFGMDKDNGTVKGRILSRPHWQWRRQREAGRDPALQENFSYKIFKILIFLKYFF